MTTDRDETGLIRSWLDETYEAERDGEAFLDRVLDEIPVTQQRRRRSRWFLPAVKRTSAPTPAITDTTEYQPSPIPATNGHTPIVIGRTTSMFSPVKAIVAGALVFAIGGVVLVGQPFQQQGVVPGAEADVVAPIWVTGNIESAPSCSGGDLEMDGLVARYTNVECSPQTWTSSDSRLTGAVVRRWSEDVYPTDLGDFSISVDAPYLRNDGGDWACLDTNLLRGSGMNSESLADATTFTCTGDGGYAGLSAILVSRFTEGFNEEFVGLIFSGDLPPLPEPPAAE